MSEWKPLSALPDLRRVGLIALDTETKDGGLLAHRGSAWPWGDGHICGVSVAYRAEGENPIPLFPDPTSGFAEFRSRPGLAVAARPHRGWHLFCYAEWAL